MIKRKLGRTGLEVSALGMGCYQFTSDFGIATETADAILDYAMDSEINLFDSAQSYGFGESEEIVGRARRRHPGKKAVFTSKVGYFLRNTRMEEGAVTRELDESAFTNPAEIKRAVKRSLWRLQLDCLDVMMIHEYNWPQWRVDYDTGESVVLTALKELRQEGVIGAIGLGGWDLECAAQMVRTGKFDVVLAAGGMNLLSRPMFDELVPACREQNTGLILGGGFGQNNPLLVSKDRATLEKLCGEENASIRGMVKKMEQLYDLADELEVSMTELAIRYILSFEEIHSHVPGARELIHIQSNLAAAERGPLGAGVVKRINAIQRDGETLSPLDMAVLSSKLRGTCQ